MPGASRDIYGRKPVSQSRGRTDERILAMQHDPSSLPGAESLFEQELLPGSIGALVVRFHQEWVREQPVTSRRAYERALVILLRDLDAHGPAPTESADVLDEARLLAHLDWRASQGLDHAGDLPRAAVNLTRLVEHHTGAEETALRDSLRARAAELTT